MTERVRELERQAEKFVMSIPVSLDINEYTSVFNEKFAELIIKDIFNVMNDQKTYNRCTYTTHDLDKAKCVVQEVIKCVNEHFGTKL
jgi:protein gp37